MKVALCSILTLTLASPARAASFNHRGVHYFDASVRCPLAGVGTRGERGCNRFVLDDENTVATVAADRLTFTNVVVYPRRTLIGDVILSGRAQGGVPVAMHLKVFKEGRAFSTELHAHVPAKIALVGEEIPPFQVVLSGGGEDVTVLDGARIADTLKAGRAVTRLITVTPRGGDAVFDVTVGAGVGRLSKRLLHARLNAAGAHDVRAALAGPSWEFSLTSLSSLLPQDDSRRDRFVHGLESVRILEAVADRGLRKGQTLQVVMKDGKGSVVIDGRSESIANAADVVRSILEMNSVGMILLHHAEAAR